MNKTFKDFAFEDLDVFFNLEELADMHELDGEMMPTVVVATKADEKLGGVSRDQMYSSQEVFKEYKTIYVRSSDYYIPKVDSRITLDGTDYYVEETSDESGVLKIIVSANES
ncbi:hypothetical protein SporoP37_15845 [Sporosarcina sp. P37]|uniref:hypothetical protein n=1 Tax=unclassified Sporosarcina TaxID=2647733 RepID=UPI000A17BA7E|nr:MULTISPECIES: hypothetical protein [unclassified Sporosarcina]ARK25999.1 hypothetical protein SporoP37_15845 [Sporosarcina sp. P37]